MWRSLAYRVSGAILLAVLAVSVASAENIWQAPWEENPSDPQWQGGSTTTQTWEFAIYPDRPIIVGNPWGFPTINFRDASLEVVEGPVNAPTMTWHVDVNGGGVDIFVPNDPRGGIRKVIWAQITSDKGPFPGGPLTEPQGTVSYPKPAIQHPNGTWYTYTARIDIPFNPPGEIIRYVFPESANISEIVIDTICVPAPEPGTFVLLGLGAVVGIGYALRRRAR
jgi:hypothetical protein